MSLQLEKHLFTVEEFQRMGEAGIFHPDARLELIEGEIVEMSPIGSRHVACVIFLTRFLTYALGDAALVSVQNPVQLNDLTQPQPDIALLRPRDDRYGASLAKPQDVLLIIEVADTTVDSDRSIKLPLYARAGIPEVWIINLPAEQIEIYAEPLGESYQLARQAARGQDAQSHTITGLIISASEVLG